jgi:DNA replication and repair protein RecF
MPIKCLKIKNFRNHADLSIKADAKFINIIGENGAGKTNILEAISLFSPGRGFRNSLEIPVMKK